MADVATEIKLAPGKSLFYEGEATKYAFNVTSGTLKTYKLLPDGRRQITGFQVTGDFLGLADRGTYVHSAEAVSATTLCRFSRDRLRELMDGFPALGHRLLEKASSELAMAHDQMVLLGRKTAREKIASFLLMLSQRANQSGHGEGSLAIEMTRTDIGDYLGLTTETVSRTFTQLKSDKILSIGKGSEIIFLDRESLVKIADGFANK
ncbi:MAG: helix-turn-helix domain-containing protein [Pseudomonadota bacterium]